MSGTVMDPITAAARAASESGLREQLAVHAPAVPVWFRPAMPRRRPDLPLIPDDLSDVAASIAGDVRRFEGEWNWHSFARDLPADEEQKLLEFRSAVKDTVRQINAWDEEARAQLLAQWPWYYADLVLAARDARPAVQPEQEESCPASSK